MGSPCLTVSDLTAQVTNFRPVTEETLRNPAPGDWLNFRRTDDAWGYSPLDEINRDNVGQLQLVWSWAMDESGAQEATPLVYDGIMYLPNPRDVIQALDAATGDLIWEYRPERDPDARRGGIGAQKNIAIYDDKIFGTTHQAHIVALDARTGEVVWDTQTADPSLGYQYSAGPIVVRGTVIAGITGCERYKEDVCFIAGLDADTGEEKWRTSTVALPGEPGGDTWGDLPLEFRAGSDTWITGSYDPEANLVYWGTSQAKPWARSVRGTDGDALYTNSTLAINPDTGELVWYYQHLPGETNDMDDGFENILIDVGGQPSLFKMGKLAILWQLNRETGAFIHATDLGYQNIVDVDPETGEVTYRPDMIPEIGVEMEMCPSTSGFKSWRAMAFSPETEAFYIPLTLNCQRSIYIEVEQREGGGGGGLGRRENLHHPASDGNLGEFVAMHVSGEILWSHRTRTPFNSAALTTAGGLAFVGDWDRFIHAYDVVSGNALWETRLPTSVQGFPITYAVDGTQYVAVPVGTGSGSWSTIPLTLTPEKRRPATGNALFVFALPD
ncbi:MAG: PQQ-binding-like beta-propeller repeat protein [Gemmatimonadetes bacterium]|nr:PQQ-binding-like beta-propeller repeat protein [Gemmatimonadota bacterium]